MREKNKPYFNFYRIKCVNNNIPVNLIVYAPDSQRAIQQYCECQSFARPETCWAEKLESKVVAWGQINDRFVDYEINDASHWAVKLGMVDSFVEPII